MGSARLTGFVGSLNDESPAGSVDVPRSSLHLLPGSGGRHSQRGEDIACSKKQSPARDCSQKGRSSMFLIYSFTASKEENTVKKSKLLVETELCQVV